MERSGGIEERESEGEEMGKIRRKMRIMKRRLEMKKKEDRKQCDYKGVEKRETDKRSSIRNNEGDRG